MYFVTSQWLRIGGACDSAIRLFDAVFPNGAEINHENVLKAIESGMEIMWLAHRIFPYRLMLSFMDAEHKIGIFATETPPSCDDRFCADIAVFNPTNKNLYNRLLTDEFMNHFNALVNYHYSEPPNFGIRDSTYVIHPST